MCGADSLSLLPVLVPVAPVPCPVLCERIKILFSMSLPVARVGGCTELSASPPSQESLRRLPWCTCVSASARQSRAQCCAREFCCKILKSLSLDARQIDDDTHERHTDTNRLTRHTASWLPHTLSRRTHNSGPHPPCRPPQHSTVPRAQTRAQLKQQTTGSDM